MDAGATVIEALRACGALKEGHFLLSSGRHSDRYIEKFDLLRHPRAASAVCALIADRYRDSAIDVVAGPTTGGVVLAFEVARQLGVASAYADRPANGAAGREFRRGTTFAPGARVLIVDDILTTGGSVRETIAALEVHPVDLVGAAVLVDRSGSGVDVGAPCVALATMEIANWDAAECPLCRAGVPLMKPGTTPGA
jgi:orotate phosphoribosyltransferase